MASDEEYSTEPSKVDVQLILACEEGNLSQVKSLVEESDADICYQDMKTGISVLMIAASAGHEDIVRYLLEEGAPWNAVDRAYMSAGDYAAKHGRQGCVDILMSHAVMSELLLSLTMQPNSNGHDETAVSCAESLLSPSNGTSVKPSESLNASYLSARLDYSNDGERLVDTDTQLAVMMDWERPLMARHAAWICHADSRSGKSERLNVLNVGFGMGIVDEAIQAYEPTSHVIIEAHSQVLKKMEADGWTSKANMRVLRCRWQEAVKVLADEIATGACEPFDGIFFDTYAEDDLDLREFHSWLPKLLRPSSTDATGSVSKQARYSYYNGVCPDNVFFHGVACETIRLHLKRLGIDCNFEPMAVDVSDPKLWQNLSTRYWYFDTYFLPKCVFS